MWPDPDSSRKRSQRHRAGKDTGVALGFHWPAYGIAQFPVNSQPVSRMSKSKVRWNVFFAPDIGDFMVMGRVTTRLPVAFVTVAPAVFSEHALLLNAVDVVPGATGPRKYPASLEYIHRPLPARS